MPKKSRKKRRQSGQKMAPGLMIQGSSKSKPLGSPSKANQTKLQSTDIEFSSRHSYITSDLRRSLIIGLSLILVLIVLYLIIR
jgi:hypothetical protein